MGAAIKRRIGDVQNVFLGIFGNLTYGLRKINANPELNTDKAQPINDPNLIESEDNIIKNVH